MLRIRRPRLFAALVGLFVLAATTLTALAVTRSDDPRTPGILLSTPVGATRMREPTEEELAAAAKIWAESEILEGIIGQQPLSLIPPAGTSEDGVLVAEIEWPTPVDSTCPWRFVRCRGHVLTDESGSWMGLRGLRVGVNIKTSEPVFWAPGVFPRDGGVPRWGEPDRNSEEFRSATRYRCPEGFEDD